MLEKFDFGKTNCGKNDLENQILENNDFGKADLGKIDCIKSI